MPTAPANASIHESRATNSATGYFASDVTNPGFFIEGAVQLVGGERVLTFIVLATKAGSNGAVVRGAVRGRDFFEAMWAHFAACGTVIDVIQAEWTSAQLSATATFTTNLEAFNSSALVCPTLETAAPDGTVTGKYAQSKGHTDVLVVRSLPPSSSGPYEDVVVQFRKP